MSKLKIRDDSTNYTATVINLPVKQSIEGLDNLVKVEVFGNECLIGKDSDPDALYLFFPAGTQLSQKFLSKNNLYRDALLNEDKTQKSFFEPTGKVKGIKLRGIISNGFVIPVRSLQNMYEHGIDKDWYVSDENGLKAGDEFNEFDGEEICRKYFPKNSHTPGLPKGDKQTKINNKLVDLMIPGQFRFHVETQHLAKFLHNIEPSDIITITDKWHGSSCILSRVYINNKLNRLQQLWNKINWLPKFTSRKLGYIYSSGKPKSNLPKGVESEWINKSVDYYNSNIWKKTLDKYKTCLEEGISLYGELVGFTSGGAAIQKNYDYSCEPATNRFMVYRITYTKPNGEFIEFSWQQIKDYCKKYSLEHVKELYFGRAGFINPNNILSGVNSYDEEVLEQWRNAMFEQLQRSFLEKSCIYCDNKVPAEGIVLRVDGHLNSYNVYKLKSKLFVLGESNSEEINIEDQQ